jgi:ArsR family transcriptional regulator, virulence genes transcriptional regulator
MSTKINISPAPLDVMTRSAAEAEAVLKLLANRHRLLILCNLVKGQLTVGELNDALGLSQSALSQHLAKMRDQGLIVGERDGQNIRYRIADPKVEALLNTLYLMYCHS